MAVGALSLPPRASSVKGALGFWGVVDPLESLQWWSVRPPTP